MSKQKAQDAFERDIPAAMQEDVCTMIAEAIGEHPYSKAHDCVCILDHDRYDAINAKANGYVTLTIDGEEREFRFIAESGNWNGFEFLDWEGDTNFEPYQRTVWTLEPNASIVAKVASREQAKFLLAKWDGFMKRPNVAEISGKYAYDRMMQPGLKVERYWKNKAAEIGFVIVSEDQAKETRARLVAMSKDGL